MSSASLWCSGTPCHLLTDTLLLWQQYPSTGMGTQQQFSLPKLIDKDADRWRVKYLSWLDELGVVVCQLNKQANTSGTTEESNYWWMTLPSYPSFTNDSFAYTIIRLWVIDELARENHLQRLEVYEADGELAGILLDWGAHNGVQVIIRESQIKLTLRKRVSSHLRTTSSVPLSVLFALRVLFKQISISKVWRPREKVPVTFEKPGLVVIDYFANLNRDSAAKFESRYWGKLPALLADMGIPTYWIHIYIETQDFPNYSDARRLISELNDNNVNQFHYLLQDNIGFKAVLKAVWQYARIANFGRRISKSDIWEFLQEDGVGFSHMIFSRLRSAYTGSLAAQNAIWLAVFNDLLKNNRSKSSCLYLMENQPWEIALLSQWRAQTDSQIFGVPHSTIRMWDLRYAIGCDGSGSLIPPRPDKHLSNGSASTEQLMANGIRAEDIYQVEALRFMYDDVEIKKDFNRMNRPGKSVKLLVLGEYEESMVSNQLELVNGLIEMYEEPLDIVFRPHPGVKSNTVSLISKIQVDPSTPLKTLIEESDAVLCGSVSSTLLEVAVSGTAAFVFQDGSVLDGQVLEDPSIQKVHSITDLVLGLERLPGHRNPRSFQLENHLNLDSDFYRWKKLLIEVKNMLKDETQLY